MRAIDDYLDRHRDVFQRRRQHRVSTSEERDRARAMRADGMTYLAIANELGRPVSTVRGWMTKEER